MTDKRTVQGFSINAISEMTGMDRRTVTNRLQGVQPISETKREKRYTLRQFINGCENRIREQLASGADGNLDPAYERARKDKEAADKLAYDNKVSRGELLHKDDVEEEWSSLVASTRAGMLNLPSKVAQVVAAETDPNVVNNILMEACRDILEELSNEQ